MSYSKIVEEGENSFGARVPDLPGCIAAGETCEEVIERIQEALAIPKPASNSEYIEVLAAQILICNFHTIKI